MDLKNQHCQGLKWIFGLKMSLLWVNGYINPPSEQKDTAKESFGACDRI